MVLQRVHAAAAILFVVAILVQVFLAGAAMANLGGSGDFTTHTEFGYTGIGIAWLILLVTAIAARRPRTEIGITVLILVLYIVQTILPNFKTTTPALAALHPVNALLLFGVAVWYARKEWQAAMA